MKKFLFRTFSFGFLLLAILFLLKASVPFYWADAMADIKFKEFLKVKDQYNTVTIGSSLINRGFEPAVFDKFSGGSTKSYSLGVPATYHLETTYLLDRLIDKAPELENVIFLVQEPRTIALRNFHSIKSKYYLAPKEWWFSVRYWKGNWDQIYRHSISFLENTLCIGEIFKLVRYHLTSNDYIIERDGFYTYKESSKDRILKRINSNIGKKKLKGLYKKTKNYKTAPASYRESIHNEALRSIAKKLESKGINCYFLHLPNLPPHESIKDLKNLYMGDGPRYPGYFSGLYRIDRAHLNEDGARLFSKRLGMLFKRVKERGPLPQNHQDGQEKQDDIKMDDMQDWDQIEAPNMQEDEASFRED